MDNISSDEQRFDRPGLWLHAIAGLQAGIAGTAWMFVCFAIAALWNGQSIWSVPNVFSILFYGENVYQDEFSRKTWAGIALIVVLYGLLGAVWGCIWRDRQKPLLTFFGALTGLATYYLFFHVIWVHTNPLIPLYAPVQQMQVAHILWGMALAKSPGYSRRIQMATAPSTQLATTSPATPEAAVANQEAAEIVSGELIR